MRPYYINKNFFETSIYEVVEDDTEYKIKAENKCVVKLMTEDLIKLVQELREQGETVTVYYIKSRGKRKIKYYKAKI